MIHTPLYEFHRQLDARLVDFAGWEMPLSYSGIIAEHHATRNGCTMFDVSHMGRLYIRGAGGEELLERTCTRRIGSMVAGQSRYSQVCNTHGGILDDVIVTRLDDCFLVVCNASNRATITAWLQAAASGNVTIDDQTLNTAMIAVQGPDTAAVAADLLPFDVTDLKRYHTRSGRYLGIDYLCSRTGYTGEDGFEIIVSSATGMMLASSVIDTANPERSRVTPAGLGARDTLRLEAGMPLYGHELHLEIDPLSAGQAWCVDLNKDFIGSAALRAIAERGPDRRLVGLELPGRRIARQGAAVQCDGHDVGIVTSGTLSPTLERSIAMAYVDAAVPVEAEDLTVDLRGTALPARIAPLPFYTRQRPTP